MAELHPPHYFRKPKFLRAASAEQGFYLVGDCLGSLFPRRNTSKPEDKPPHSFCGCGSFTFLGCPTKPAGPRGSCSPWNQYGKSARSALRMWIPEFALDSCMLAFSTAKLWHFIITYYFFLRNTLFYPASKERSKLMLSLRCFSPSLKMQGTSP